MDHVGVRGLISPLILRAKVLIRRLQGGGGPIPWDKNMAKEEKVLWAALSLEVQNSGVRCFPRAEAPLKGEEVHIVAFADGSMTAVCACV